MLRKMRLLVVVLGILVVAAQNAAADLYVLQVGDGATPLSTSAAALTVQKFADAGGSPLATLAMPTSVSGANNPITVRGSSTTESFMHLSTNGQYLVMGGYAAAPGTANPDTVGTNARVVGRVQLSNFTATGIDTTTALTDAFLANSFRSVASTDGTSFWMGGTSSPSGSAGVRYATLGSTTSTQVSSTQNNTRVVNIFNDATNAPQLYVSSGAGAGTTLGINIVGTGLPTTSGSTITLLQGISADASTNPMDFWFKDANTIYKANGTGTGQGIAKYEFNSGTSTWDLAYILNPGVSGATGAGGITGTVVGGNAVLYATNYLNELVTITDTGSESAATLLANAPTNTTFRGIAFVPSAPAGVSGDYNGNGIVDAADYVLWRNGGPLQNDINTPGTVDPSDYTYWRSRFGATSGGSGSGLSGGAAIPEPATGMLLLLGLAAIGSRRRGA